MDRADLRSEAARPRRGAKSRDRQKGDNDGCALPVDRPARGRDHADDRTGGSDLGAVLSCWWIVWAFLGVGSNF
jgi:hypothetical protein